MSLLEALRYRTRAGAGRAAISAGREVLTYGALWEAIERRAEAVDEGDGLVALDGSDPIAFLVGFFAARARGLATVSHPPSCPPDLRAAREGAVRRAGWPGRGVSVFYSSGSVSPARAVPLSDGNLLAAALAFQTWGEVSPKDCVAVGVSPAQVFGLVRGALNALLVGAEVAFFIPRRDPLAEAAALAASILLLPSALATLASRHGSRPPVRALRCGGGPVPENVARAIEKRRGVPVRAGYGLTETAGLGSRQRGDFPRRPGSCGRPAPGLRVSIVGPDGEDRGPGGAGEIRLQGPAVFAGYLSPEDRSPFDDRGRLMTGDIGAFDEEGELFVRGRLAFAIPAGDRILCAEEVEAAIAEHPGVAEAAAVPVGRAFGVLVVPREDGDGLLAAIRAHAERRLPSFARPRRIVAVRELPRTDAGKIDRPTAARWLAERP